MTRFFYLTPVLGGPRAPRYPVVQQRQVIGRSEQADIALLEPTVSRKHAVAWVESGRVMLEDTGSTHGTFVNSKRISRAVLEVGDIVVFGLSIVLKLEVSDTPIPPAPPLVVPTGLPGLFGAFATGDIHNPKSPTGEPRSVRVRATMDVDPLGETAKVGSGKEEYPRGGESTHYLPVTDALLADGRARSPRELLSLVSKELEAMRDSLMQAVIEDAPPPSPGELVEQVDRLLGLTALLTNGMNVPESGSAESGSTESDSPGDGPEEH